MQINIDINNLHHFIDTDKYNQIITSIALTHLFNVCSGHNLMDVQRILTDINTYTVGDLEHGNAMLTQLKNGLIHILCDIRSDCDSINEYIQELQDSGLSSFMNAKEYHQFGCNYIKRSVLLNTEVGACFEVIAVGRYDTYNIKFGENAITENQLNKILNYYIGSGYNGPNVKVITPYQSATIDNNTNPVNAGKE